MRKKLFILISAGLCASLHAAAQMDSTALSGKIDEVVVTGTRNATDVRHLPMTVTVLGRNRIAQRNEPSLLPLLNEQVPGLFITSRGMLGYGVSTGAAGGMTVRGIGGSPTTGVLVLIDGHPQYAGLMGHPIADAYQSMLAEKVEVVRGPASMLYGSNAMGGVINIVTRKERRNGIYNHLNLGIGSYGTVTAEYANNFRRDRFSSTAAGSYSRTDGHRANSEFEQFTGFAKVNYDISPSWNVFADFDITHFTASNPGLVSAPIFDNDSRITRIAASAALENHYDKTSGALKFFYNGGRHKINDGFKTGETPLDYRFNSQDMMLGVSWYQSASFFTGNCVTFGVDFQHFGGEAWNKYITDGNRTDLADKSQNEVAAYVNFRQALTEFLTADAGIRWDKHSQTGAEWIPQIGLSWQVMADAQLKATVSKGFRNPTIRELYMFRSANPDLLPERIMNYELSFTHRLLDRRLSYGVNVFYLNGDNLIQTVRTDGTPKNINTGKVENWGVELQGDYSINPHWTVNANYSWLRMVHKIIASPEHKFYVGGTFQRDKWRISSGLQYINTLYTSVNPEIKESFVLLNLQADYRFNRNLGFYLKGDNLLAQRYEINAGYPMPKATFMGGIKLIF